MADHISITPRIELWRWTAFAVAIVAIVFSLLGLFAFGDREHFFRGYLFAWFTCLSLSLGGMSLVMIHNLTGGEWGRLIRRPGETAALLLPALAILFIPIAFGMSELFPWARPAELAASDIWQHRHAYLNEPFFFARAAGYLLIWIIMALLLVIWQRRWDKTQDPGVMLKIRALSGAGIIIYTYTLTNAGIDWLVSRDEHFYSTAFGLVLGTGQTLFGTAFAVIVTGGFSAKSERQSILARMTSRGVRNDVGNILLVMVILWTYVTFMQFLVIWMGNTQDDNGWFVARGLSQPGPWRWVGLFLIVCHFFIPFFILLFRGAKQYGRALVAIAWLLFVSHLVDEYWLVAPSGKGEAPRFDVHWLDLTTLLAVGGIWLFLFLTFLPREWIPSVPPLPESPGRGVPAQ